MAFYQREFVNDVNRQAERFYEAARSGDGANAEALRTALVMWHGRWLDKFIGEWIVIAPAITGVIARGDTMSAAVDAASRVAGVPDISRCVVFEMFAKPAPVYPQDSGTGK